MVTWYRYIALGVFGQFEFWGNWSELQIPLVYNTALLMLNVEVIKLGRKMCSLLTLLVVVDSVTMVALLI